MARKQKYSTAEELEEAKPMSEWTTRELRMWIRQTTKDLNEYTENVPEEAIDPRIEKMIHRAQKAAQGREEEGLHLGLNLTYKRKDQLMLQARRLKETRDYNLFVDENEREAKKEKARRSFNQSYHADLTEEEYSELVDTLGASDDYFRTFGYEDLINNMVDFINEGVDATLLVNTMSDIVSDLRSGRLDISSTEEALDELYSRLSSIYEDTPDSPQVEVIKQKKVAESVGRKRSSFNDESSSNNRGFSAPANSATVGRTRSGKNNRKVKK